MAVDWIAAAKGQYTEDLKRRDLAWSAAVRATAELEGEITSVLPLSIEEVRLLTLIRKIAYYIAESSEVPTDTLGMELRKYVGMLGHIRQHKEQNG